MKPVTFSAPSRLKAMPPMDLEKKLKLALNENRLLILGTQVLFGFQFNGIFQELFVDLPYISRALEASGLTLLMIAVTLLIAPSMHHRIVEGGLDNPRVLALAGSFADWALLPIALALAFDMLVATAWTESPWFGVAAGVAFFLCAIFFWYVLGFLVRRKEPVMAPDKTRPTPLDVQVDQLLTEARLIIPGAQALLGFQFAMTLMRSFEQLPSASKQLHLAALCCIGLAVILLMAPASLHRIAFGGEDHPDFVHIGSWIVAVAPLPLALGITLDTYVAAARALDSDTVALVMAAGASVVLLGTWYVYPLVQRLLKQKVRR